MLVVPLPSLLNHTARPHSERIRSGDALNPEDVVDLMAPDEAVGRAQAGWRVVAFENGAIRVAFPPEADVARAFIDGLRGDCR